MNVGIVAIGRNEGERLMRCLDSVIHVAGQVVYVDSGSTDDSVTLARAKGATVVELDMGLPFTAARARNEGFRRLRELGLAYVQFLDGDCELADGWLERAASFLDNHEDVAVVCGRLRERYPTRSVYNMLCDIEWDTPVGVSRTCGGNAMMRANVFEGLQGYRAELIAGEEPELCVRIRASGWRIWRLGEEMAIHDAAMTRFSQWWKRTLRGGHAYAQGAYLHGKPPECYGVRESRSAWFWGLGAPIIVFGFTALLGIWSLSLFLIYPLQVIRLAVRGRRSTRENWLHAGFLVLGKFPEMIGHLKFMFHHRMGSPSRLMEYK